MLHPVIARQGQVGGVIRAAMLLGNDVVNMEGRERLLRLRDPAIFTAVARTLAHQAARCRVDHAGVWLNNRRALACSTLMNSMAATAVSYSARSSADSCPSVHLSASSSRRACTSAEAWRSTRCRATSGVRQSPTGVNSRSRSEGGGDEESCVSILSSYRRRRLHSMGGGIADAHTGHNESKCPKFSCREGPCRGRAQARYPCSAHSPGPGANVGAGLAEGVGATGCQPPGHCCTYG